jgi:hypothetical protein
MIITWSDSAIHIGTSPLVFTWAGGGAASTLKTQRGNIDYDQIRLIARQGNGASFQMFNGVLPTPGHALLFDGNGNAMDAGGPPPIWVGTPAHYDSPGLPGRTAYDSSGNFYFCCAVNSWAQIGPGGYSNSF